MILKTKKTLFLFLSTSLLVSCQIRNTQKYYSQAEQTYKPFDAIIVPGVPFENGNWSRVMKLRVGWAKYLWDKGMTRNIIFSGGAVYTKYSECKIMRLYALEMGIPDENIYLDSLAEHSTENVFYSTCLAKANGFKTIAVASDPYQTKSLKAFAKKTVRKLGEIDIQLLPAIVDTVVALNLPDYKIDYETAIGDNFVNITETQGLLFRLRGTMGLHIDWDTNPYAKTPERESLMEANGSK